MYGFDTIEIIAFIRQFGLAVSGAASLWGLVFIFYKHVGRQAHSRHVVLDWISWKMLIPFYVGLIASFVGWLIYESMLPLYAHEGIIIVPDIAEKIAAGVITNPVYITWFVLNACAGIFVFVKREKTIGHLKIFFGTNLAFIFFLISLPAWVGGINYTQLFHIGHGFHSIFTFGTVVVLDFLFLLSFSSFLLKEHIYPLFPLISKVIWIVF